jgi:hypothetical protein
MNLVGLQVYRLHRPVPVGQRSESRRSACCTLLPEPEGATIASVTAASVGDLATLLPRTGGHCQRPSRVRRPSRVTRLFSDTGMRCSELANLGLDDLDPDSRVSILVRTRRRPATARPATRLPPPSTATRVTTELGHHRTRPAGLTSPPGVTPVEAGRRTCSQPPHCADASVPDYCTGHEAVHLWLSRPLVVRVCSGEAKWSSRAAGSSSRWHLRRRWPPAPRWS